MCFLLPILSQKQAALQAKKYSAPGTAEALVNLQPNRHMVAWNLRNVLIGEPDSSFRLLRPPRSRFYSRCMKENGMTSLSWFPITELIIVFRNRSYELPASITGIFNLRPPRLPVRFLAL